jgi:DNA repair exonuclease SbcCD ATPase subunit
MDILTIALTVALVLFIALWAVAESGKAKMKLTAESAIMRNTELSDQIKKEQEQAKKRVKTLASCESKILELEQALEAEKKQSKNRLDLATTYGKKIEELEKDIDGYKDALISKDGDIAKCANDYNECAKIRDRYKSIAEEGERTIQSQAKLIGTLTDSFDKATKQIEELTKGDASGEVGRGKAGKFTSKKAS